MSKKWFVPVLGLSIALAACGGQAKNAAGDVKSMEKIQAEEGVPVTVRQLKPGEFSVELKFPTTLRSRSESTAYASISDVVRSVPVKVGDKVERDQVIVTFSNDNPQYQQAKLSFENAQSAFSRSEALFRDSGLSKQDFDNVRTQYELARSGYKQVSDMVEVKAPIDGYVTRINVRPTENVHPGSALFTVSNQDGFETRFYVSADEIDRIKVGERASLSFPGGKAEGSVVEVSLIMDPDKKAFPATAFFAGKGRGLVSGLAVDVAVETYRSDKSIVVERKELLRSGDAWYAFVVVDGKAQKRAVVPGRERGLEFELAGGLKGGELLVSSGAQSLSDGQAVKVVETSAAR